MEVISFTPVPLYLLYPLERRRIKISSPFWESNP
jgi:hypothetical protein